jgi:hypothetical protein
MLVYPYFKDDNNTILMDIQFEMYSYSISTIAENSAIKIFNNQHGGIPWIINKT